MASVLLTDGGGDVGKAVICKSHLTTEPVLASSGSSCCKTSTRYSAYPVTLLHCYLVTAPPHLPLLRSSVKGGRGSELPSIQGLAFADSQPRPGFPWFNTVQRIQQIKAAPFVFSLNNSFEFGQADFENLL